MFGGSEGELGGSNWQQSKLKVLKELMKNRCKTRCVDVESNRI